ncbi:MAG: Gfo/Idh/MocA family oxidoreductase [Clostridia bacterium]|nr:Gfo/Idh/MocA family oxidoreductase [Clostridia bacterium]
MKKIVLLGCENSHAATFMNIIKNNPKYSDIEVIGCYSHETAPMENLNTKFGIPMMESYDQAVGEADGVVVVARHGDNHLKYAKPYFGTAKAMFIDKPITVKEEESLELISLVKKHGVKIAGGSCIKYADFVKELKKDFAENVNGETLSGVVRCPVKMENPHGGFYFYSQHLVEAVCEIFGRFPKSVTAVQNEKTVTVVFRYQGFDVVGVFTDNVFSYSAVRMAKEGDKFGALDITDACFESEFDEFYEILSGADQKVDNKEFISPVFILNAIERALKSGKEEAVKEYEV